MANAQAIKLLVKKRGNIKAQVTNFTTFLRDCQETQPLQIIRIKMRLEKFKETLPALAVICDELDQLDENVDHNPERLAIQDQIIDLISETETLLASANPRSTTSITIDSEDGHVSANRAQRIKLPEAKLPNFDGKYEQWFSFKSSFLGMIGNRRDLGNNEKLQYLKSAVSGNAACKLAIYDITDENYVAAWETLEDAYQDEKLIVTRHLSALLRLPAQEKVTAAGISRLVDHSKQHVRSLKNLGIDIPDQVIMQIVIEKLPNTTRQKWDESLARGVFGTWKQLTDFLLATTSRIAQWESEGRDAINNAAFKGKLGKNQKVVKALATTAQSKCVVCAEEAHPLFECQKFRSLPIQNRIKIVSDASLCQNCLRAHKGKECKFRCCLKCNEKHNTLLHEETESTTSASQNRLVAPAGVENLCASSMSKPSHLLTMPKQLATQEASKVTARQVSLASNTTMRELMTRAAVDVYDCKRRHIRCRALLDTCSTANFITERLVTKLKLPKKRLSIPVGALNAMATMTKHVITATIRSIHDGFEKTLTFLTIPHISDAVPSESIARETIKIPPNLRLADPEFHKSMAPDLLIGSGPTLSMLSIGQINCSAIGTDLILQKTRLGWVIGGSVSNQRPPTASCFFANIERDLTRFWDVEEGIMPKHLSPEELACEKHFRENVTRNNDGRYVVTLPFKDAHPALGESRGKANNRLNSLQRKLKANPTLRQQYTAVIDEYLRLGHMSETTADSEDGFYLPHHAVIKESSNTTKIRVVFDGSATSTSGISLNDILMVGPMIQDDLFSLILRFRSYNYVITADVEKMYRQFIVRREDRKYQRILWQTPRGRKTYELNTVTFGLAPAPFLAIRCLHQLAEDEGHKYPAAAKALKRDLYVDDLLTGAPTVEGARKLRKEIIELLKLAGLRLRQWASNEMRILEDLPTEELNHSLYLDNDQTVKTLGISWNAGEDVIRYTVKPIKIETTVTKRQILSEIAKIFDPLGLLGPVIFYAKCLMQRLWLLKVDWDESVTHSIYTDWTTYCEELSLLINWTYSRRILTTNSICTQVHGFCDASERGYGACLYIRSSDLSGNTECKLLCSKSRVAPLKVVTIPRLELCAAQLLANLYAQVVKTIDMAIDQTFFWSDSMITLHWINTSPHVLKTFIANRVSEIQNNTQSRDWRHIRSEDNPADSLSRGQLPSEFMHNAPWRDGPL